MQRRQLGYPQGAYSWQEKPEGRFLDINAPCMEHYYALEDFPGLFLTVAEMQPDESGVLTFANAFGSLWSRPSRVHEWEDAVRELGETWKVAQRFSGNIKDLDDSEFQSLFRKLSDRMNRIRLNLSIAHGDKVAIAFNHNDLIDLLYVQLTYAMVDELEFRACASCGKYMLLKSSRSKRLTCSDACRVRHSRAEDAKKAKD